MSDDLIKKYGLKLEGKKALLELNPGSKHPERLENLNKIPELKKWVEESQNVLGRKTPIAIWKNEAFMNRAHHGLWCMGIGIGFKDCMCLTKAK
ncbi:MAG: hypothetical protein AB1630_13080 [bacterium]